MASVKTVLKIWLIHLEYANIKSAKISNLNFGANPPKFPDAKITRYTVFYILLDNNKLDILKLFSSITGKKFIIGCILIDCMLNVYV